MTLFFLTIAVLLVGFVLQSTCAPLPFVFLRMDIAWVVVVFLGFFIPLGRGGLAVLMIGLIQESIGGSLHGVLPLSYLAVYFFLRMSHQHLFFQGGSSQVIWILILALFQKSLEGLLLQSQGYDFPYRTSQEWVLLGMSAFLQGMISLPVFALLKKGMPTTERYGT